MTNEALRDTFFAECEELIEALTEDLEIVAGGVWDVETINAIFRAVHSIKGAAGAFGFTDLVAFAHHYETILDLIRSDKLEIDGVVLRLITRSSDTLAELVDCSRVEDSPLPDAIPGLTAELEEMAASVKGNSPDEPEPEIAFTFMPLTIPLDLGSDDGPEEYAISFQPNAVMYQNGHEPLQLFAALKKMGELHVTTDFENVPELSAFDFDEGYLDWDLTLHTTETEAAIADVFNFVEGLCELKISPVKAPALPEAETPAAVLVEALIEPVLAVEPGPVMAQPTKAPPAKAAPPQKAQSTLRVDPERVDRLINSVGELIINQAVINQNLKDCGLDTNSEIISALEDYGTLAREIQEGVMSIRAQPVKSLFQRMGRVVREAGEATGKAVNFVSEGEATEIDKTMLERLADPLTHMLRNAVDHGIEDPATRLETGKDQTGTVNLSAAHRSGHVVIEIRDDGAGLNRERLLSKAIEKGIVSADAKLSESEIDALLFAPGFSTAENVTNLSGRGVGMDVVKTAITSLGGKVGITSQAGKGSRFTISLPLTLAVLDGMIVKVGAETMVIPLSSVIETVRPKPEEIREAGPGEMVLYVRGAYVPVVDSGALLGMRQEELTSMDGTFVLIDANNTVIAVYVDAIHDQRQVVIKSLKGNYGTIDGIAAATILGDGKIALIIDPEALLQLSDNQNPARQRIKLEA
jgi:two-component system chemotaxis sensor kinase CheA